MIGRECKTKAASTALYLLSVSLLLDILIYFTYQAYQAIVWMTHIKWANKRERKMSHESVEKKSLTIIQTEISVCS